MTFVPVAGTVRSHPRPGSNSDGNIVSLAATLSSGGHPNSNMPGRRKEDDVNLIVDEPYTFDWQAGGGGSDTSFKGKSRTWIDDKPGRARSLVKNKTLAVHEGATVRRLTPTECERLQALPTVEESVRIIVWRSSENHPSGALAEGQNPKSPESALAVDRSESTPFAWSAEEPSRTSRQSLSSPVVASVRIDFEHGEVRLVTPALSSEPANTAGEKIGSPRLAPCDDFAQLVALTLRELARQVPTGKVASPPSSEHSGVRPSGSWLVEMSGQEIDALASDADRLTQAISECMKSTTSPVGPSSPTSDSTLRTLCFCVTAAIVSCIPAGTLLESSYAFDLQATSGWTNPDGHSPDSRRYAGLGDAVTASVGQWLGERLIRHG